MNSNRKEWKPSRRLWVLILSLALILSACAASPEGVLQPAGEQQEVETQPLQTSEEGTDEEPVPELEPEREYAYRQPLTGLGTDVELKERPVIVMVENSPKARPQSGLNQADLVYEVLAEGDITRFIAVYHSESPQVIGPVRSIRPYFVEIGDGLDGYIVHAGWSQDAMNVIAKRKVAHFDQVYGDDAYYWRDSSRKAPHNLYTNVEKIREGAVKKKFRQEWNGPILSFTPKEYTASGSEVDKATINYIQGYQVSYEYEPETAVYKRFMAGQPHKDKDTGIQLWATNILICKSRHKILDNVGRRTVDVFGPGKGYLLQQGKMQEMTWERKDGVIRPYLDGQELPLLPGKTWIQIVPEVSKVVFE